MRDDALKRACTAFAAHSQTPGNEMSAIAETANEGLTGRLIAASPRAITALNGISETAASRAPVMPD